MLRYNDVAPLEKDFLMKCEFCNWNISPEVIPSMARHIEANHPDIEEFATVWRDGEMLVARSKKDTDIAIHVDVYRPRTEGDVSVVEILDAGSDEGERDSLAENAVNEDLEEVV